MNWLMVINFLGNDYFKISSGETTILIDPENQRSVRGATLILNTVMPAPVMDAEEGPAVISHQGEYEVQGIHITGWSAGNDKNVERTIYRVEMEGTVFAILGQTTKEPEPKVQEFLADCDVLILPAGGKPFLEAAPTAKLIRQLEPSLVVPSYPQNVKALAKEMGQEKCPPEEKLVFKQKDLKPKAMEIKCLNG